MKVGDKVAVLDMQRDVVQISHVERETKLHWIVSGVKYSKVNLVEIGDRWYRRSIEPLTQKHLDKIKKSRIASKLSATKWEKLDLETLEKVFAIVCGMTETKGGENEQH